MSIEADRVRRNTDDAINRRIDHHTACNIRRYVDESPAVIERRISELNDEWDIERMLEANAATLALAGVILTATVSRKWLLVPSVVLGFLLLHAMEGWCPPLPLLRRAGVRTRTEIDREKLALKYVRGDFDGVQPPRQRRRLGALVEAALSP